MTTLLEAMTSEKYTGLVIIIAGYEQEIHQMLEGNPGLKSRFTNYYRFEDWRVCECTAYFEARAKKEGFAVCKGVGPILDSGFEKLLGFPGWANARDVISMFDASVKCRASRVYQDQEIERKITETDVTTAMDQMVNTRTPVPKKSVNQQPRADQPQLAYHQQAEKSIRKTSNKVQEAEQEPENQLQTQEPAHGDTAQRDAGVDDAIWEELEKAKKEHFDKLQRIKDEAERKRLLEEQRKLQEEIRKICPCPAGFSWFKQGGGWRCGGGSHFVSDEELKKRFTNK